MKNINASPITTNVTRPLLIAVQDYIVSFCYHPLEVNTLARTLLPSFQNTQRKRLAVGHCRIVLNVNLSNMPLDGFCRVILVEHQVVEGQHVFLFRSRCCWSVISLASSLSCYWIIEQWVALLYFIPVNKIGVAVLSNNGCS
jgi:hypothetical protein